MTTKHLGKQDKSSANYRTTLKREAAITGPPLTAVSQVCDVGPLERRVLRKAVEQLGRWRRSIGLAMEDELENVVVTRFAVFIRIYGKSPLELNDVRARRKVVCPLVVQEPGVTSERFDGVFREVTWKELTSPVERRLARSRVK